MMEFCGPGGRMTQSHNSSFRSNTDRHRKHQVLFALDRTLLLKLILARDSDLGNGDVPEFPLRGRKVLL